MSKKKPHVYLGPGSNFEYRDLFNKSLGMQVTDNVAQADIVCFTGGSDVSPHLYGAAAHDKTYASASRDIADISLYRRAQATELFCVGICRGGQFLNVMNGGTMWQHIDGHGMEHMLKDKQSGDTYKVSSTHHQMMRPGPDSELVATAHGQSHEREDDKIIDVGQYDDVEVVWYPRNRSLCFQPHPEFHYPTSTTTYFKQLMERYFK